MGRRVPDRLHAVSCCFPTLEDLRGYEERRPEAMARLGSGYPRFVVHPLVRALGHEVSRRLGLGESRLWLCCSRKAALDLQRHLGSTEAHLVELEGVFGVSHPEDGPTSARAKLFLQHTGRFLPSREAEDVLYRLGLLDLVEPEVSFSGDAEADCWRHLAPLFEGAGREDAFFVSTGMNAVYSAFSAVNALQVGRGRDLWVQLGWLYVDTIAIMRKFSGGPDRHLRVLRVDDRAELERVFAAQGSRIAGVIAEVPTNPLIQTPDVNFLRELADKHGALLILDPTVASAFSVDLFPYADVLVCSLTKYAAHEGDVIAGLVVVNPRRAQAAELRAKVAAVHEPVYARELARLAVQMPQAAAVTGKIESNLKSLVAFLEKRPEVGQIFWSRAEPCARAFEQVARNAGVCGGMLSFELKVPMEPFHDAVCLAKGPSFGMQTTLLTPFIWLAHYDLVTTEDGRAELAENGINPDLIRLSVGVEPVGEIIAVLEQALRVAAER